MIFPNIFTRACFLIIDIVNKLVMDQDIRQKIMNQAIKIKFTCSKHPQEIANMFITEGIICGTCYTDILQVEQKTAQQMKPLKFVFSQVHQSCTTLISDLNLSAFIDHHIILIRTLAKTHFPTIQDILQASITSYFQRYRDFVTGRYFQQYYATLSSIISLNKSNNSLNRAAQIQILTKKLVQFICLFFKIIVDYDDYQNLTFEEKITGHGIVKQIKSEVGERYKQFREKITSGKKHQNLNEEVIQFFNVKAQYTKFYRFSNTLIHSSLKLVDSKKIKIPDLPDNQYTLLALIEPSIGSQKKSIKFKMEGIKGWVAVGIAIRKKAEQNNFKFESGTSHGTFQISYDGYSWSEDSSVNEQYISWYYNEGDTVTLTVNPLEGELTYIKNDQTSNPYTIKFKTDKKDKLYFCVSLNYSQDSVSIIE